MKPRILVADDEPDVLGLVRSKLAGAGFDVLEASDGIAAIEQARRERPCLIVLDIMMPELTGLEVTRVLKRDEATSAIPIILLSAHADEVNRVLGLELGAEDFLSKPFSPRELVLRARNILRHRTGSGSGEGVLRVGVIQIEPDRHVVRIAERPAMLTTIEFKLLALLARFAGRVMSREQLLGQVWGAETEIDGRTVDTHVRRLREKLGAAGAQIRTVRGFGYRLDEEPGRDASD